MEGWSHKHVYYLMAAISNVESYVWANCHRYSTANRTFMAFFIWFSAQSCAYLLRSKSLCVHWCLHRGKCPQDCSQRSLSTSSGYGQIIFTCLFKKMNITCCFAPPPKFILLCKLFGLHFFKNEKQYLCVLCVLLLLLIIHFSNFTTPSPLFWISPQFLHLMMFKQLKAQY